MTDRRRSHVRHQGSQRPAHRGFPWRAALSTLAATGLLAGLVTVAPASAAIDPCNGASAPTIAASTVNQGLGSYTPLVRGKTTLVRLFLTAPTCAAPNSLRLVSARVTATENGAVIADRSSTPSALGPTYPVVDSAVVGVSDNGPANPIVVLPALGAGPGKGLTTVSFAASLTYTYQLPGEQPTTSTTPLRSVTTADLAPSSSGLRVLAVPMGDASAPRSSQFPTQANGATPTNGQFADTIVQNAMATTARLLPVPDGVADLTSTTGGLRYRLNGSAMVDLGPAGLKVMPTGGKACVDAFVFTQPSKGPNVASLLADHLSAWNSANPSAKADRVLGVLWQGISGGTAGLPGSTRGCAEGLASIDGSVGYIRLLAGNTVGSASTPNPTMSGALSVMELMHTLGGVPSGDPRSSTDLYHSKNVTADPADSRRAYDTGSARYLPAPQSALNYSGTSTGFTDPQNGKASGWNDTTVLLEREDYRFAQCELGPNLPLTLCPPGATRGSVGVAAAAAGLVISGTTDGTAAGTDLVSSYDSSAQPTAARANSDYRLVLRDGAGAVIPACGAGEEGCSPAGDRGLDVAGFDSVHDHDAALPAPATPITVTSVYAALAVDPRARSMEIWKGTPGAPCTAGSMPSGCLYARATTGAPVIATLNDGTTLADTVDLTPDAGPDTAPALAPSAGALAWVNSSGLVVQRRDPESGQPIGGRSTAVADGREPSWSPDGTRLAYVTTTGVVRVVAVSLSGPAPVLGAAQTIYDPTPQVPTVRERAATSPSWSPDGQALAVAINGGIWRLAVGTSSSSLQCDLTGVVPTTACRPFLMGTSASQPDWGGAAGTSGLVAYVQGGAIRTLDPDAPATTQVVRVPQGASPSWGAGLLSFAQSGAVWLADPSRATADGVYAGRTRLTPLTSDAAPSLARATRVLALQRDVGGSLGVDVIAGRLSDPTGEVELVVAGAGDPTLLRADLLLACGHGSEPAVVALRPDSTTGTGPGSATFRTRYDGSCSGGALSATVSNGWDTSPVTVRTFPVEATDSTGSAGGAPSPAVSVPVDGSTYLQYDSVLGASSTIDVTGTNTSGTSTRWLLTGPAGSGFTDTVVGTAPSVQIDPPSPGGFVPGSYALTVEVTNASGRTGTATSHYVVLPDPQHLGSNVGVEFAPSTLYLGSQGRTITLRVTPQAQQLELVPASSVRISSVGGLPTSIPVLSWKATGSGVWKAKFDRQQVIAAILASGRSDLYVPVVLSGGSGGSYFAGYDPRAPFAKAQQRPVMSSHQRGDDAPDDSHDDHVH